MCDPPNRQQREWFNRYLGRPINEPIRPGEEVCTFIKEHICRLRVDDKFCANPTAQTVAYNCGNKKKKYTCTDLAVLKDKITTDASFAKQFSPRDIRHINLLSTRRTAEFPLTCAERDGNKALCQQDPNCQLNQDNQCVPQDKKYKCSEVDATLILQIIIPFLYHQRGKYQIEHDSRFIADEERAAIVRRVESLSEAERCLIYQSLTGMLKKDKDKQASLKAICKAMLPLDFAISDSETAHPILATMFNYVLCALYRKKPWHYYFFLIPNAIMLMQTLIDFKPLGYAFFKVLFEISLEPNFSHDLNLQQGFSVDSTLLAELDIFNKAVPDLKIYNKTVTNVTKTSSVTNYVLETDPAEIIKRRRIQIRAKYPTGLDDSKLIPLITLVKSKLVLITGKK
jgi:hypothetical protein